MRSRVRSGGSLGLLSGSLGVLGCCTSQLDTNRCANQLRPHAIDCGCRSRTACTASVPRSPCTRTHPAASRRLRGGPPAGTPVLSEAVAVAARLSLLPAVGRQALSLWAPVRMARASGWPNSPLMSGTTMPCSAVQWWPGWLARWSPACPRPQRPRSLCRRNTAPAERRGSRGSAAVATSLPLGLRRSALAEDHVGGCLVRSQVVARVGIHRSAGHTSCREHGRLRYPSHGPNGQTIGPNPWHQPVQHAESDASRGRDSADRTPPLSVSAI